MGSIQHLDEGLPILSQENAGDDRIALAGIGVDQFEIPALKKRRAAVMPMVHRRVERAAQELGKSGHNISPLTMQHSIMEAAVVQPVRGSPTPCD